MTDTDFRLMLTLFVSADPCPLIAEDRQAAEEFFDREARERGWPDWLSAYHDEPKRPQGCMYCGAPKLAAYGMKGDDRILSERVFVETATGVMRCMGCNNELELSEPQPR